MSALYSTYTTLITIRHTLTTNAQWWFGTSNIQFKLEASLYYHKISSLSDFSAFDAYRQLLMTNKILMDTTILQVDVSYLADSIFVG